MNTSLLTEPNQAMFLALTQQYDATLLDLRTKAVDDPTNAFDGMVEHLHWLHGQRINLLAGTFGMPDPDDRPEYPDLGEESGEDDH